MTKFCNMLLIFILFSMCSVPKQSDPVNESMILSELDHSIDSLYSNFIDLGNGYVELANCRLTLFKDGNDWAMVFEKFGYNPRSGSPVIIETSSFGNCLENLREYNGRFTNVNYFYPDNDIFHVLEGNKDVITIRNKQFHIPIIQKDYSDYGIKWDYENKNYEGAVLKYLAEIQPELTRASESEVRQCLPSNLKKIMTIDSWHQEIYHQFEPTHPPSTQETFQMIAKVLVTGNTNYYKPTKQPNTHWSNWPESGGI